MDDQLAVSQGDSVRRGLPSKGSSQLLISPPAVPVDANEAIIASLDPTPASEFTPAGLNVFQASQQQHQIPGEVSKPPALSTPAHSQQQTSLSGLQEANVPIDAGNDGLSTGPSVSAQYNSSLVFMRKPGRPRRTSQPSPGVPEQGADPGQLASSAPPAGIRLCSC